MKLDPPHLPLGQLQRGLGRGYLRARRTKAVDTLLHCIHNDPRWSRQSDPHASYYARLALELKVDVDSIASHFGDDVHSLTAEVLRELGARGVPAAFDALRDALQTGAWRAALWSLNTAQRHREECLVNKSDLSAVVGHPNLAEWVQDTPEWRRWATLEPRLRPFLSSDAPQTAETNGREEPTPKADTSMTTAELLDIACRQNRVRLENVLEMRRDAESTALMRAAARNDDHLMRWVVALRVLGRQGDASLVDECEARLASASGAWQRGALLSYLKRLDGEHTLALARRQQHEGDFPRSVALHILAAWAKERDREALTAQLHTLFEANDMYHVGSVATALGTIANPESADVLVSMFESVPFPYIREALLIAIHRCSLPKATALTPESLFDCDGHTRRWATIMAKSSADVDARIVEMAGDHFEWEEIRKIANERKARTERLKESGG